MSAREESELPTPRLSWLEQYGDVYDALLREIDAPGECRCPDDACDCGAER